MDLAPDALDTEALTDLLFLASALLIAFGLGLQWEQYTSSGNYPAILLYGSFMFYAAVHFYKQLR